jgi:hypothetical protein
MILCGTLLLSGCTEQSTHRSYTNAVYDFSLDPPEGWQQIENELPNIAVWFSPVNLLTVSLIVEVPFMLGEGRALSTIADQVEENLSENGMNYTILYRDWRSISNLQAYEIAYTYEQNEVEEYVKKVAVLRTQTVFLITFTAPYELSSRFLTEVDQSIDSFM